MRGIRFILVCLLLLNAQALFASSGEWLIILDLSSSMVGKINWAKEALTQTISGLPPDAAVGLQVLGRHDPKAKLPPCEDTELLVPVAQGGAAKIQEMIPKLRVMGSKSPIAYSLQQAGKEAAGRPGQRHRVVILTDGQDNCGGDPAATLQALDQAGTPLDVSVIGLKMFQKDAQAMEALAQKSGVHFQNIKNVPDLAKALQGQMAEEKDEPAAVEEPAEEGPEETDVAAAPELPANQDEEPPAKSCGVGALFFLLLLLIVYYLWRKHRKTNSSAPS